MLFKKQFKNKLPINPKHVKCYFVILSYNDVTTVFCCLKERFKKKVVFLNYNIFGEKVQSLYNDQISIYKIRFRKKFQEKLC